MRFGRAITRSLSDVWDEAILIVLVSLLGGIASLSIILAPLVLVGHATLAWRMANGYAVSWRDWVRGMQEHWLFAYVWAFITLAIGLLLLANWQFYGTRTVSFLRFLQGSILAFGLLSSFVLTLALLFNIVTPKPRLLWRNSLFFALQAFGDLFLIWLGASLLALLFYIFFPPFLGLIPFLLLLTCAHLIRLTLEAQKEEIPSDE